MPCDAVPSPGPTLSDEERAIYEWQTWVPGVGADGQRKLKGASVLVSGVAAVGCLAATEAIKLITGIDEPLADRLLKFDLRDVRFRTVGLMRRPGCAVWGGK
ncbi:MAG: hypothetical protein J2P46_04125 [Zavarzinella sp.]|nr:hypothetical protein [Zavarzinella sp.]